jgi:hypothetical protein
VYLNVRPFPPRFVIARDRQDSSENTKARPVSMPWSVRLIAKDPRVYVDPAKSLPLVGGPFTNVLGSAVNRGDYETPLNIMLVVGALPSAAGTFRIWGLNNIDMTITIEKKANVIYRWFGDDRVLMTQDSSQMVNGVPSAPYVLRMELVSFATQNRRPSVPALVNPPERPFATPFHYTSTVVPFATGSRLFWNEAFA